MKHKVEPFYQKQAKELVDALFNKGLFNPQLTRDGMQTIEDLIAFHFSSNAEIARKSTEFLMRAEKEKYESN